ncbi:MAG TPA: hypothetical protein VGD22_11170 [Sphingobacteriaceae bacterium]
MAVYRFKVSFEDYDDVIREIDIKSNQTFEDLHKAIHSSTGYDPEKSSSFYVSNDHWIKGDEIAFQPNQRKIDRGVALMSNSKLSSFIEDPHQKFYYTYNFDRPFDFHVELIKILLNEEPGKSYPNLFRRAGEVPKLIIAPIIPDPEETGDEADFDFINEMDFVAEDTEDLETITDLGFVVEEEEQTEEPEEEKEGFMDEFSDNENFDSEDFNKEDY